MSIVLISVKNDAIRFSYKDAHSPTNFDNNIIKDNELSFSKEYIKENEKVIALFIKELCRENNIYRVTIESNDLALFLLNLLKKNSYISAICISEDASLSYSLYEKIIENNNINYIEANSIPQFMIELLDQKGIRSEARSEILYPSNFMQNNNLTNYSKIFYKMNVHISNEFTEEDHDDFLAFCHINKYLKTIHLDVYNKNDLEIIIEILIKNKLKNIQILIYDNIRDLKTIEYLKKTNKKIKKNKLHINLVYSKDYLKENIFAQIIVNTLKICGLILFILVISVISYVGISNYTSLNEVTKIQEKVKTTIEEKKDEDKEQIKEDHVIKNSYISSLFSINQDVVGWLKVNNTNVDYPVVQGEDNDYYLKHNLYNENDKNGWIFMDYRNSLYHMDANTIIYGHNMYYSGVMFGTLTKAIRKDWYSNPDNLVISFNTIYETMNYQVFSIYKTPVTKDYLKTYFADDNAFNDFVKMIKSRSVKDFEIEVKPGDKILTLSTCTGDNERLVVHAKLIT